MRTTTARVLVSLALLANLPGCREADPGPDLAVEVPRESLAFQPTTGDPALCCCRIVGRVINPSTVAVHVTLRFRAFEPGQSEPSGTAIDFLATVLPQEERQIEATGLLKPCDTYERFVLEDIDVNGVWFP